MTAVAVLGDGASTTALGLASVWPADACSLVELDPGGGSLAAWLDLPLSPGLAELAAATSALSWEGVEAAMQPSRAGVPVLVAPARAVEAAAVVHAAGAAIANALRQRCSPVVIVDCGRSRGTVPAFVAASTVAVVCHRQSTASAAAAALGLERVAETTELLAARSVTTVVALIGERPYARHEVARFLGDVSVLSVAADSWAASVLAGRPAPAHRLHRSALMRSLTALAEHVQAVLEATPADIAAAAAIQP